MRKILYNPSQIITVNTDGQNFKRGDEMNDIHVLADHSIIIEDDIINSIVSNSLLNISAEDEIIDVSNKIVLPGLIDCHTHIVFSGSRANEFKMKLAGVDYEEIARQGGGIISTVKAVRESSEEDLFQIAKERVEHFISQGITSLEIKSGYGLDFENEIKILKVIKQLKRETPIDIVPTFLGAHTIPPEYKEKQSEYVDLVINEMLPYVAENSLADYCDVFCEATAFSTSETKRIFEKATQLNLRLKLHTDQFNNLGGLDLAIAMNADSVDHLEVLADDDIPKIAGNELTVVLLPGVSFFLNYDFAPARKLIDSKAAVALSTDFNPGSSHIANLNLIMSLAALKMKMTIEETITAVTINAAKAINVHRKTGSIEPNKSADFSVFDTNEYADIVYNVGKNLNCMTIKNGKVIYRK